MVSFMNLLSSSSATCVVLWRLQPLLDLITFHASPNLLIERDLENERVGGARQMVGRPKKNSLTAPLALVVGLARVTQDEVRSAVRSSGLLRLEAAQAVVLETDGSLSVVKRGEGKGESSLAGVGGP